MVQNSQDFWLRVKKGSTDVCWSFQGYLAPNGYGKITYEGRKWLAHRLAFHFSNAFLDPNLFVLHSCDIRACCNPNHLRQGTAKENTQDMYSRGRDRARFFMPKGSAQNKAKLTEAEVLEIRALWELGLSAALIAPGYPVSASNIEFIVSRKTWRHI